MPTNQSFPYPHTPTYLSFPYPQTQHQPYEMADVALRVNLRPYEPETGEKCLSTAHEIVIRSDDFTLEWLTKTCIALDVLKQSRARPSAKMVGAPSSGSIDPPTHC